MLKVTNSLLPSFIAPPPSVAIQRPPAESSARHFGNPRAVVCFRNRLRSNSVSPLKVPTQICPSGV